MLQALGHGMWLISPKYAKTVCKDEPARRVGCEGEFPGNRQIPAAYGCDIRVGRDDRSYQLLASGRPTYDRLSPAARYAIRAE